MDDVKNIVRGIIFTLVYIIVTIVIPYSTFSYVKNLSVFGMLEVELSQAKFDAIIFWVVAFGLFISGCAFFAYSSPKNTIRRAVFSLIQIILNCFYIWSYKFSGALEIQFAISDIGFFYLNLQNMILVYLGIYFLTILIKIYDVADFSINRFKIREEKELKLLKKEVK